MENAIVILILIAIVFGAAFYIYRAKKAGKSCIGCPYAGKCKGGCHCEASDKKDET